MGWWREAVFYEIYVRSFQDSNGDGIGDLNGITTRLPYLADLGANALWITPFYPSPQVDFGYDVSDYEAVDPQFGTLADFERLVEAAHRAGLKVTIDLVLNHTSDQHPWFRSARASRSSPYRDWYVWRDGRAGGAEPPSNWESAFGGPAWTRDPESGEWYYHCFYKEQPDLNWRNPAVEARMFDVVRFWLDRGVDGFRLDAVNTLFEDERLHDNPPLPEPVVTITGVVSQRSTYTRGLREVDQLLLRLRRFTERQAPDAVLISEAYVDAPEDLIRFYDAAGMHLPFNFFLAQVPSLDPQLFGDAICGVEAACGERWPSLVLSNHDIERACDRYPSRDPEALAHLLAVLLCTLRGTPFLYYGEEIAMRTVPPASADEVRDPVGRRFWPGYKGRDGSRRPMQWEPGAGGGFTTGVPWLPVSPDVEERNVRRQQDAGGSVFHTYRTLLRLRRSSPALRAGALRMLDAPAGVLAFLRDAGGDRQVVVLNMTDRACALPRRAAMGTEARVTFGTHASAGALVNGERLLEPFEGLILQPLQG